MRESSSASTRTTRSSLNAIDQQFVQKAFATQVLPIVAEHRKMAENILAGHQAMTR